MVARALAEDLGVFGDLTASLVPPTAAVTAVAGGPGAGVLAGRLAATETFAAVDPAIEVRWAAADGDRVDAGQVLAAGHGPLASVLTAERTALNLLGHLSGVATLTRRYVDAAGARARIRDTRKTTPGLAGPREGRGPGRRRGQPPGLALRRHPGQGQPPGRHLHRGRGRRGPDGAGPPWPSRWSATPWTR